MQINQQLDFNTYDFYESPKKDFFIRKVEHGFDRKEDFCRLQQIEHYLAFNWTYAFKQPNPWKGQCIRSCLVKSAEQIKVKYPQDEMIERIFKRIVQLGDMKAGTAKERTLERIEKAKALGYLHDESAEAFWITLPLLLEKLDSIWHYRTNTIEKTILKIHKADRFQRENLAYPVHRGYKIDRYIQNNNLIGLIQIKLIFNDERCDYEILRSALFYRRSQVVSELVKYQKALFTDPYSNQTIFVRALELGFEDVIRKFIDIGFDVNSTAMWGESILHLEIRQNCILNVIQRIVSMNVNVNLRNDFGRTPLSLAFDCTSTEDIFDFLISIGSELNTADNEGRTPLIHALGRPNLVEKLLKAGANLDNVSGKGLLQLTSLDQKPHGKKVRELFRYYLEKCKLP